jgi:hypothetical protein
MNTNQKTCAPGRAADFQVCCIAGFQTCGPSGVRTRQPVSRPADLEIGDTAGLETCATVAGFADPRFTIKFQPLL